jgi:MFS family permease
MRRTAPKLIRRSDDAVQRPSSSRAAIRRASTAAFLLVRLVGSRLVDDIGPRTVALGSIAVEALALLGIAFAPNTPLLLAALVALGAGVALVFPSVAVWLVENTPDHERGAALGAMTSCWDVGIAVAGPAGALVVSSGSFAGAFILAAGACAVAAAALARGRLRRAKGGAGGSQRPHLPQPR